MSSFLILAVAVALVGGVTWAAVGMLSSAPKPASTAHEQQALSPWAIIAALLLPIVGLIIAIVLLAQGRGAHGGAVLLTSMLGWVIAAALFL